MRTPVVRGVIAGLVVCVTSLSALPPDVQALPTGSLSVERASAAREAQVEHVLSVLSQPAAQWHLRVAGVTTADVRQALAGLDDAQLASVAQQADRVRVAGDAVLVIGISLGTILLVALAACIIYLIVRDRRSL